MKYQYSNSSVAILIRQIIKTFTSTRTSKNPVQEKPSQGDEKQLMLPVTTTESRYTDTMATDYGSTY